MSSINWLLCNSAEGSQAVAQNPSALGDKSCYKKQTNSLQDAKGSPAAVYISNFSYTDL